MSKKAIILLSGGLDSSTVLAIARAEGYECYALTINYRQRHNAELVAARNIANFFEVKDFKIVDIDLSWLKSSALTNKNISIPENPSIGIPVTYVPARNTIMMTLALAWAETIKSQNIFIGVNSVDYSGYPDCRPEYIESFQNMANLATKSAVEGNKIKIHTPLIEMTKAEIILKGIKNQVDYKMTVSCYQATENGLACGKCDSCRLRIEGFESAKIEDPTNYKT
ncbi:7-cyano-7-deazaguanine synthase QueC [Methylophilaceae bacterium]|nr:7-cyano-7-deazaguanine synthase QueC [Methylophilaceae bacterium]